MIIFWYLVFKSNWMKFWQTYQCSFLLTLFNDLFISPANLKIINVNKMSLKYLIFNCLVNATFFFLFPFKGLKYKVKHDLISPFLFCYSSSGWWIWSVSIWLHIQTELLRYNTHIYLVIVNILFSLSLNLKSWTLDQIWKFAFCCC